jgi:hypothetical protein
LSTSSMHVWTLFSAVDLIQHRYLDILYNYIYYKYDKLAVNYNWTKLWSDTLWMLLFQNYVQWPCLILKMAVMASDWLKNWKSLKIFFRTTGWIKTKFSQNAVTAHPPRADESPLKSDHCFTQLDIQITICCIL